MALMILGLVLFLGVHSVKIVPGGHDAAVRTLGAGPFKLVYSFVAVAGLLLVVVGYGAWRAAGPAVLYQPPLWAAHVTLALMLVAFVLFAATYGKSHIRRAVRHPMLLGLKVWAFAHLLANGDAASVTLFAAVLAWAVVDRISVKRRERAGEIAPRAFVPSFRDDAIAVIVGAILYALFVWKLHLWLIGVSPIVMSSAT
jgi:uncharacterized membrane protein